MLFVAYALTKYVVPGDNPVTLLIKLLGPVPSLVLLLEVVGFCVVLQHIPLADTADPPSNVIAPPVVNDDAVMLLAVDVVKVGITALVVPTI